MGIHLRTGPISTNRRRIKNIRMMITEILARNMINHNRHAHCPSAFA